MSYLWPITIFLIVALLASFVLNILFLAAVGFVAMVDGREPMFTAMPGIILLGLVFGFVAAVVAFLRECVRFWRISDEFSGDPKPPPDAGDWLNEGPLG